MFTVFCSSHEAEVLLTTSHIEGLGAGANGDIEIRWRCWCGTEGRSPVGPPRMTEPAQLAQAS